MVGLIPEPKKYRYFIAGEGDIPPRPFRFETLRDKPITSITDILQLEGEIAKDREWPNASTLILYWRRFEEAE